MILVAKARDLYPEGFRFKNSDRHFILFSFLLFDSANAYYAGVGDYRKKGSLKIYSHRILAAS